MSHADRRDQISGAARRRSAPGATPKHSPYQRTFGSARYSGQPVSSEWLRVAAGCGLLGIGIAIGLFIAARRDNKDEARPEESVPRSIISRSLDSEQMPEPVPSTPHVQRSAPATTAISAQQPSTSNRVSEQERKGLEIFFERRGKAMIVPVTLHGRKDVSVKMLLDTGATHTTVTRALLAQLGGRSGDATIDTYTANGLVKRDLAVIDGITIGSARIGGGVAVVVCDQCASPETVGLLGLNFTRNFVLTIDHAAGVVAFKPRGRESDRTSDIRDFIRFADARSTRNSRGVAIRFSVKNTASRPVFDIRVAAQNTLARSERLEYVIDVLGAGEVQRVNIRAPSTTRRGKWDLLLNSARW